MLVQTGGMLLPWYKHTGVVNAEEKTSWYPFHSGTAGWQIIGVSCACAVGEGTGEKDIAVLSSHPTSTLPCTYIPTAMGKSLVSWDIWRKSQSQFIVPRVPPFIIAQLIHTSLHLCLLYILFPQHRRRGKCEQQELILKRSSFKLL